MPNRNLLKVLTASKAQRPEILVGDLVVVVFGHSSELLAPNQENHKASVTNHRQHKHQPRGGREAVSVQPRLDGKSKAAANHISHKQHEHQALRSHVGVALDGIGQRNGARRTHGKTKEALAQNDRDGPRFAVDRSQAVRQQACRINKRGEDHGPEPELRLQNTLVSLGQLDRKPVYKPSTVGHTEDRTAQRSQVRETRRRCGKAVVGE